MAEHRAARVGLWLGPLLCALLLLAPLPGDVPEAARRVAALTALVATWWMTEALPLGAASLVPLVGFPVLGVLDARAVAKSYVNEFQFLFLGGFLIAFAIERWGLHRRLALHVMRAVGTRPHTLLLGVLASAAFLSMWLSNTATAVMMLPIVLSVADEAHDLQSADGDGRRGIRTSMLLGLAYGCNVGGMATPIGTPPNLLFQGVLDEAAPGSPLGTFGGWTVRMLPLVAVLLLTVWLVLSRVVFRLPRDPLPAGHERVREQLAALGPLRPEERRVAWVFAVTVVLLLSRQDLTLTETIAIPGWSHLFPAPAMLHDAVVALGAGILLFLLPAARPGVRLLDWDTARRMPWHILLLLGAGFAIAGTFEASGLSHTLGGSLEALVALPGFVVVLSVCLLMTALTELTSNTATTAVMLPILAAVAESTGSAPATLMLPAALSASCAFMLPVATPPNALVFGSGRIAMGTMVRTGIVLNGVCALIIASWCWWVAG